MLTILQIWTSEYPHAENNYSIPPYVVITRPSGYVFN